ncbi:MAG TPA: GspH/FimT family pseudopilin [Steroidobacteraceae bacterium]|nr:GspH/FimT family pseudopilin [Steroidobacteraceae bacterium]
MKLRHTAAHLSAPRSRDRDRPSRPLAGLERRPRRTTGFTLLEVVVVMAIVGILFALAMPSMKYFGSINRISSEINGLLGDMQFARSQAIQEGQTVTICSSSSPYTACSASASWQSGWIVFMDANGNKTVDPGEIVLRVQAAFTAPDTLVASGGIAAVTFSREGFALGLPGTVTMELHDATSNPAWTRCLAVSIVGQLTTETSGVGACL